MSQNRFVEQINAQVATDPHPPYRHIAPLNRTSIGRILAGSFVPDADTLYRIARYGFGFDSEQCCLLEDIRYEAWLLSQEEKRTTQQLAVVTLQAKGENKEVEKIPDWVLA